MRLINVDVVIKIVDEPIIDASDKTKVLKIFDVYDDLPLMELNYAILSHRWRGEEINFEVMNNLTKDKLQNASGRKLVGSCRVAHGEEIKWLWIDSCCIGVDTGERKEAINSMYRWYRCSKTCYTYLHDVSNNFPRKANGDTGLPEWFSRGWTLQELIAPTVLKFFNESWQEIGDRRSLASTLNSITGIPEDVLHASGPGVPRQLTERFGVARVMSWAADRKTSKPEDRAYSLVGLFGVHLEAFYGEGGDHAFQRLQEALIKEYGDQSIFSWSGQRETGSVLADSPSDFRNCTDVIRWVPPSWDQSPGPSFEIGEGLVTTRLRLTRCRGSSYIFQAELACCRKGDQRPITITLAEFNDKYYKIVFGDFDPSDKTEKRKINLCCRPVSTSFMFDVSSLLGKTTLGGDRWERDIADQAMSLTNARHDTIRYSHVASSASHRGHDKTFTIILGFFFDTGSVHVEHDGPSGKVTHDVLHHANCIDRSQKKIATDTRSDTREVELVMHSHIPRTIQAVEVIYKSKGLNGCSIILNVVRCVGCCIPGWVSVKRDPHNMKIAECFRRIRQSYFSFVCPLKSKLSRPHCFFQLPNTVTTATPSSEVDIIVKSFVVKVLSKAAGPAPKKWFLNFPRMSILERNKSLSEAEKQAVACFFEQIKTDQRPATDILAYELLNYSVGSIRSFPHRN